MTVPGSDQGRDERRRGARRPAYAALDLGTNNCRLLIARPTADGFVVIDAFSRIVRLGEGIGIGGAPECLCDMAMARTLRALHVCARKMRKVRLAGARCVATEACRRATNGPAFLARVKAETGLEFEVISRDEEAQLAVCGCAPLLDPARPHALIFDIGGGSTELTWAAVDANGGHAVRASESLRCGVVSLSEVYGGDRFSPTTYDAMVDRVAGMIAELAMTDRLRAGAPTPHMQMVGTSGTATTIAGLHLGLDRYDRDRVDGETLSFDAVAEISARLRAMDFERRAAHPCIGHERADLVVAGCAILEAICRSWPVGHLRVADRGIREGILHDLMAAG